MPVSRGRALVCSAALHTLGIGVAGWITYGQYRGPAASLNLYTTRAHAFHFLTLTRPKPQPEPQPRRQPAPPRAAKPVEDPVAGPRAPEPGPAAAVPHRLEPATQPSSSTLQVRELAPGTTVGVVGAVPAPVTQAAPVARGVDRAAALVVPAGSACPELLLPGAWARRDVAVAVALEVDDRGQVDRSKLRVVQSPGREATGRRYYPRIYVVGAKAERSPGRADPAAFDSVLTKAVAGHVADLEFRPAMRDGRPVGSTVLIACHWSPGG